MPTKIKRPPASKKSAAAKPAVRTKAQKIRDFAREKARTAKTWMDLHNAVYGIGGKFSQLFPTQSERVAFSKTEEFGEIKNLIDALPGGLGLPDRSESSGKFVLRLPASLHAALVAEAQAEGVSLNQLCLAKLAAQLRAIV